MTQSIGLKRMTGLGEQRTTITMSSQYFKHEIGFSLKYTRKGVVLRLQTLTYSQQSKWGCLRGHLFQKKKKNISRTLEWRYMDLVTDYLIHQCVSRAKLKLIESDNLQIQAIIHFLAINFYTSHQKKQQGCVLTIHSLTCIRKSTTSTSALSLIQNVISYTQYINPALKCV